MEAAPGQSDNQESNDASVSRALIVTGGDGWHGALPRFGGAIDIVVAADSGVDLALELGLPVSVVIGDLDSASPAALEEAEALGATIERHPAEKDATDLELAMDYVSHRGATHIVVIGGSGGRLSHLLANASLIASAKYEHTSVRWLLPEAEVIVVRANQPAVLEGMIGDLVSLVPIGGEVAGITTAGLKWALHGDALGVAATQGISNELVATTAEVSVESGSLLVIKEGSER